MDEGSLAMDRQGPTNFAPIDVANALMPQAYTQYRDFAGKMPHYLVGDARFQGGAGSRRDNNMARGKLFDLRQGNLVIAIDCWVPAQFSQVLGKVVNKGIIIV
jgi:hypothetical protein